MKKHHKYKFSKISVWLHKNGRILFLGKINLIFYISFFFLLLSLSALYIYNLAVFALFAKIFPITNAGQSSLSLLLNKFTCSATFSFLVCSGDILLLLGLAGIAEIFIISRIILLRKVVHLLSLSFYFLVMQTIVCLSIVIFMLSPQLLISALTFKANSDIQNALTALSQNSILKKMHIETSEATIADKIHSLSLKNFSLYDSNPVKGAVLSYMHVPKSGKQTLYYTSILPNQLDVKENKNKKLSFQLFLFPNNTLIIARVDKQIVEKLVPLLADNMVRGEFGEKSKTPTISFPNDKDYNAEQKKQEDILLQKQKDYISYLESFITDSDSIIQKNQAIINSYTSDKQTQQKAYDDYVAQYSNWYNDCKAQLGNDPVCEQGKSTIDSNLNVLHQNIQVVDDDYKQAGININLQTEYKQSAITKLATAKQNYQEALDNPVTPEFQDGVFDPPSLILVRYYDKENKLLSFYLDTAVHEYLHFYSSSTTKNLDTFLEEGITDYLKLKILSKYVEPVTLLVGYPNEVEIIATLQKRLPKNLLISFYFDKDQTELEKWFTDTYGASAYNSFVLDGKALTFTPLADEKNRKMYTSDMEKLLNTQKNFSSVNTQ